jgi:hypothetical protein
MWTSSRAMTSEADRTRSWVHLQTQLGIIMEVGRGARSSMVVRIRRCSTSTPTTILWELKEATTLNKHQIKGSKTQVTGLKAQQGSLSPKSTIIWAHLRQVEVRCPGGRSPTRRAKTRSLSSSTSRCPLPLRWEIMRSPRCQTNLKRRNHSWTTAPLSITLTTFKTVKLTKTILSLISLKTRIDKGLASRLRCLRRRGIITLETAMPWCQARLRATPRPRPTSGKGSRCSTRPPQSREWSPFSTLSSRSHPNPGIKETSTSVPTAQAMLIKQETST